MTFQALKNIKRIVIFFVFFLFVSSVYATGTAELGKTDYVFGETALFSGFCTSSQEENRAGYIVFQKADGTILQSNAANSGPCTTSFFGDTYTFAYSSFSGNATFSLNADGTGTPLQWGNVGDVIYSNFTVNQSTTSDCVISFPDLPVFDLGRYANFRIITTDGNTSDPLVHASCAAHIHKKNGVDHYILSEPYNLLDGHDFKFTGGFGNAHFEMLLDRLTMEPDSTYVLRIGCHCLAIGSEACYIANNTLVAGFKTCEATTLIRTGKDYREPEDTFLSIIIWQIFFIIFLSVISLPFIFTGTPDDEKKDKARILTFYTATFIFMLAVIEVVLTMFIILCKETFGSYTEILDIHFIFMFMISGWLICWVAIRWWISKTEKLGD